MLKFFYFIRSDKNLKNEKNINNETSSTNLQEINKHYQLSIFIERGKGFLQNIMCLTIVPKHVLISKLSFPIQIRQINDKDSNSYINMLPNTVQNFHYPDKDALKLLEIRTIDKLDMAWCGEIDISNLGEAFLSLSSLYCTNFTLF